VHQELSDVFLLARATNSVVRQIDRTVNGYHGIGLNDLRLLVELQESPDGCLRRVDLAERMGVTPSGVARQLAPLERIGVVDREKHPSDARLALVVLTAAGDEMATNAAVTAQEVARRVLGGVLSSKERATLRSLLRVLS
jgi:DNA-binding MarR family transcriptional regulator